MMATLLNGGGTLDRRRDWAPMLDLLWAAANDGTGDTLREAFEKVNGSLDTLAAAVPARLLDQWAFAPLHHEHDNAVARYVNNAPPSEPQRIRRCRHR